MSVRSFVDTNVLVYYFSTPGEKRDRAGEILLGGVMLSVQVLNELAHAMRRKLGISWEQFLRVQEIILATVAEPVALTLQTHRRAVEIASRYGFDVYDGLIVAAALEARCTTLYTEDLHHGQVIDGLRIENPFRAITTP